MSVSRTNLQVHWRFLHSFMVPSDQGYNMIQYIKDNYHSPLKSIREFSRSEDGKPSLWPFFCASHCCCQENHQEAACNFQALSAVGVWVLRNMLKLTKQKTQKCVKDSLSYPHSMLQCLSKSSCVLHLRLPSMPCRALFLRVQQAFQEPEVMVSMCF